MRTDQPSSNIGRIVLILVAAIINVACSEKSAPDRAKDAPAAPREQLRQSEVETGGDELHPDEDKIAEDCVAFVRSTKVVSAPATGTDCPGCPAGGTEVLAFRNMKTYAVSCSGDTCFIVVTIQAVFNPGAGETFAGGLTGWIPPEKQSAYLNGQTPPGEQVYRVRITYKLRSEGWKAVEFERAPVE